MIACGRGRWSTKGLAVIARPPYQLLEAPINSDSAGSFLPCLVTAPETFNVLAVWTHRKPNYVAEMWAGLDRYETWIRERPTVIAGDFNSHPQWDRPGRRHTHKALEQRLREEFGLVSAWHAAHPGAPEPATLYQRYLGEYRSFHIDYCFLPEAWTSKLREVTIGSFEDYEGHSDHRPLMIDVEL
jgi:endonuclease/exonuclease/phosphatase family metal-dependent hydrolase